MFAGKCTSVAIAMAKDFLRMIDRVLLDDRRFLRRKTPVMLLVRWLQRAWPKYHHPGTRGLNKPIKWLLTSKKSANKTCLKKSCCCYFKLDYCAIWYCFFSNFVVNLLFRCLRVVEVLFQSARS